MCLLAYLLTEGIHHTGANSRSLSPFLSVILWQAAGNAGFVYSNYVTTARSHAFIGLHGGFRDLIIVNALIPILALACTSSTGITHHLFPTDEVRGISSKDEVWSAYSRLFGRESTHYESFEESIRTIPLWHRIWLYDNSDLVTINNFIDESVSLSDVNLSNYDHVKKGIMDISLYEYFYEDWAIENSLNRHQSALRHGDSNSNTLSASFGLSEEEVEILSLSCDSSDSGSMYSVPILREYERYLSSKSETVSPFMYLLQSPIKIFWEKQAKKLSIAEYPNPFHYRGLCLVLTFLGAFVLGMHTPYAARSGLLGHSVSAKEYSSGRNSVIMGVFVKVFLVCFAVLHHFRWLLFIPMYHLIIRLTIYAIVFFSIIAITCISSPSYYLHLHHWAMGLFLLPMSVMPCIYWTCFLQGFALSQFVEGASRWSCAPLWHARGQSENFRLPRKSVVEV